jgi:uncharacterized protein YcbK (DUF882 family)
MFCFSDLNEETGFGVNAPKLQVSRRDLMRMGAVGVAASVVPIIGAGSAEAASRKVWGVSFRQAHTGESYSGIYRVGNKYLPEAFERLNYLLRDFRTGDAFPMDPRVIDILSMVQAGAGRGAPLEVLSGYRSPKTNAMLRGASSGVANNSFHMYGQAVDIRIPGYNTVKLAKIARGLRAGGVGYYPKSSFVHVDTGDIRSW